MTNWNKLDERTFMRKDSLAAVGRYYNGSTWFIVMLHGTDTDGFKTADDAMRHADLQLPSLHLTRAARLRRGGESSGEFPIEEEHR